MHRISNSFPLQIHRSRGHVLCSSETVTKTVAI